VEGTEEFFRITSEKKVFEIRPLDIWNKRPRIHTTDEDAYSDYYLKTQSEAKSFLEALRDLL